MFSLPDFVNLFGAYLRTHQFSGHFYCCYSLYVYNLLVVHLGYTNKRSYQF